MAAAAVVVGPRLASWYDNFAFRDKVSRFAATLNLARVEAMRQGEPIVLSGLEGGHSLMVGKKLVDFGPSARILRLGSPWAPEEDGLVRIFFYPDGSADGSEVELEGPAGVILIQIHPVTGRVFLTWADS